ncbi:hypothetical protein D3C76_1547020 [compost metagenome]
MRLRTASLCSRHSLSLAAMAFLSGVILVATEVRSSGTASSLSTITFSLPATRLMVNNGRLIDLMLAASMLRRR